MALGQSIVTPSPLSLHAQSGGGMYLYSNQHRQGHDTHTSHRSRPFENFYVEGIVRISRHPMSMSFAIYGLANVLQQGYKTNLLFWGGFPIFYLFSSLYQDACYRPNRFIPPNFWTETSILPFFSMLTGHQSLSQSWDEMGVTSLRIGAFTAIALFLASARFRRGFWYPHLRFGNF